MYANKIKGTRRASEILHKMRKSYKIFRQYLDMEEIESNDYL